MMKYTCGILRKNLDLNALRFFEIHKVFLQNHAFLCLKFFSQSALVDFINAYL